MMTLTAIKYNQNEKTLSLLDQRLLPSTIEYVNCKTSKEVINKTCQWNPTKIAKMSQHQQGDEQGDKYLPTCSGLTAGVNITATMLEYIWPKQKDFG